MLIELEALLLEKDLESLSKLKPADRLRLLNRMAKMRRLPGVSLRVERLSGKCVVEKDCDLILRNFVRILYALMANYARYDEPSITLTDVGGVDRTGVLRYDHAYVPPKNVLAWFYQGGSGDDTTGILIGQGTTAPARTDYNLEAQIPHGTGAGQINHIQMTYEMTAENVFRLTREFISAGSDLNVSEAGLVYRTYIDQTGYKVLLLRDVFTAVPVATGNGIRVRYSIIT